MTVPVRWLANTPDEDKESFSLHISNSHKVLSRLREISEEYQKESLKRMKSKDSFSTPAWSEKQAFELGMQKALDDIIKLTKV